LIARTQCALEKDIVFDEHIFESHVTTLPDGTSIVALHDVTQRVNDLRDRERAEEKIRVVAMQDALTGLPNRMDFNAHLDDCLAKARLESASVAVLLFDFNRFKEVNDLFGHAAGDQILRTAAARLREVLTEGEYCARLGGDEFVLIQYGCTSDSAIELARRVVDCLQLRIEWEDKIIEASVTLGVATFPSQGESRQELLANADLAMYRGKSAVDRSVCVFDASMDQFIRNRRALAHDLRRAIVDDELTLDLQPQVGSSAGEVVGFESLLRWHSPSRGMVSPAEFIPIAEENGLIIEIDKWVLQRSCRLLAQYAWLPRLAVNISARAICQSNLVNEIRATLLESGISPARLELEVTETALVHDLTRALHNLRQIKALGISIAMDDFGTGYSSLSLLNSFPFDRIKIDGSFIQLTGNNERADAIFKAVIGLGAALRVPVLAEGIETEQQLLFAIESGCEELQGFHFGRPISERLMVELWTALNGRMTLANLKEWQDLHNRKAPDQTAYQMATG
jgi:diguanylate cyclase (GGDEF)-like protein